MSAYDAAGRPWSKIAPATQPQAPAAGAVPPTGGAVPAGAAAQSSLTRTRPPLPADAHDFPGRALLDDGIGARLPPALSRLGLPQPGHGRARLSLDGGLARALQDAQHLLWRSARRIRRQGWHLLQARHPFVD